MKITDLATVIVTDSLDGSLRNPLFQWTEKHTLLVFIRTESGVIGVGEAWCAAGSPLPVQSFIEEDVRPRLIGMDARNTEQVCRELRSASIISSRKSETDKALSAVDIALWDIKGKVAGLPLWQLLGGNGASVQAYASGGLYRAGQSPQAFAEEHQRHVREGFDAVKIKVGGASLAEDIKRVSALRKSVGIDVEIMIDGVANLTVPQAISLAKAVAPFDIKWFEQPVRNENLQGLARIRELGGLPIAGNENESGLDNFRRLIESGAVDYVQFDPVVSGGFSEGRKIAALAEAAHLPVTIHHSNSIVSMLANIHLAAALPNCVSIEYHIIHRWLFDKVPGAWLKPKGGVLQAPYAPGLGCDLSELSPW